MRFPPRESRPSETNPGPGPFTIASLPHVSVLALALGFAACAGISNEEEVRTAWVDRDTSVESRGEDRPAGGEVVADFRVYADRDGRLPESDAVSLERVSTAVPWPRGLVAVGDEIVVLARGKHRNSGGIDPAIDDLAGSLLVIDPAISEPVRPGRVRGPAVEGNGRLLAAPQEGPFQLYDPEAGPPIEQDRIDRPYCTLAYDESSQNFFICAYSGVDLPRARFRKNATDSIHRYDLRDERWHVVEAHDPDVVDEDDLGYVTSNDYYPHHDPATNAAPHGWLNGPDGACVAGRYLYAAGKDNHTLAQYDLSEVREDPEAGPPPSRVVFEDRVTLRLDGVERSVQVLGHCATVSHGGFLYVGFRTSSIVLRFPLDDEGDLVRPIVGELIATFTPWSVETGDSANLIDLAVNSRGELFASCATRGRIWKIGVPDPEHVFDGIDEGELATRNAPYADLRVLTGNPRANAGNIVFDDRDRLYICSGNYDSGTRIAGVIYRAVTR